MKDFDYEVLQRKRLAQQARHKRNGSKSRKCSLPSDGLTQKQWKERNGEVMTYNLSGPMKWADFKFMPADLQQQYITKLRDVYGATGKAVADMLGVTPNAFSAYLKRHGINVFHRNGGSQPDKAWWEFLDGRAVPEFPEEEAAPEPEVEAAPPIEEEVATAPERAATMSFDSFTLHFSGPFDREALCNSLAAILQNGQRVRLEIKCEMEGD